LLAGLSLHTPQGEERPRASSRDQSGIKPPHSKAPAARAFAGYFHGN